MSAITSGSQALGQLDEARFSRFHWMTVLIAGMGFFTDAYDLFIIGTVTAILTPIWHLSTSQLAWLNSASLLSSVAGALVFGRLMDRLGRKAMYGVEVSILTLGAVLSAFSWSFPVLLGFRLLVGFGVGGDYAGSAIISAEYANRKDRGRLIGSVFAMQGFGLLAGPAVAAALLGLGVAPTMAWRLMLALGAVPAASVIFLRRRMPETPRYALSVQGDLETVAQLAARAGLGVGLDATVSDPQPEQPSDRQSRPVESPARLRLFRGPYRRRLLGTAGGWMLMDIAFYGNSVSNPLLLKSLQPRGTLLSHTVLSAGIFLVAALPGYWLAVRLLDRLGRRRIQWQGFLVMAVAFALVAAVPAASTNVTAFLCLFGVSYFFVEFGPNETTFVYPTEVFPTAIRGSADGFSAAAGKLGAFIGALAVPHILAWAGLRGVMGLMAVVSAAGCLLTLATLPETRGLTLEEASGEVPVVARPESATLVP